MIQNILGIDPGSIKSAYAVVRRSAGSPTIEPVDFGITDNATLVFALAEKEFADFMAIEKPYCMRHSGNDVTETIIWTGRFIQAWPKFSMTYTRPKIGWHILGQKKWNDSKIRKAVINRIFPEYTKKEPGILEGVKEDIWQALAVAITAHDLAPWGE